MNNICPKCKTNVNPEDVFCPHCGTRLEDRGPISTGQKIKIYLLSFLLAPFGLYWFFKFYKSENPSKKTVAKNVLWVTGVALIVMLISGIYAVKMYNEFLNSYLPDTMLYGL